MFDFFKTKVLIKSDVLNNFSDFHSHLLPGVDDGVKTLEETLNILDFYESIGVQKVVFTPHIMADYPRNTADFFLEQFALFKMAYQGNLDISLGAEYMLDNAFPAHLDSGRLLTVSPYHLLVETSYMNAPMNFELLLKKVHTTGYHVLLAHPERYNYMRMSDYKSLKDNQIKFQLNLFSLTGGYGDRVKEKSLVLLQKGYYDVMGSDLHSFRFFKQEIETKKISMKTIKLITDLKQKEI